MYYLLLYTQTVQKLCLILSYITYNIIVYNHNIVLCCHIIYLYAIIIIIYIIQVPILYYIRATDLPHLKLNKSKLLYLLYKRSMYKYILCKKKKCSAFLLFLHLLNNNMYNMLA